MIFAYGANPRFGDARDIQALGPGVTVLPMWTDNAQIVEENRVNLWGM